jgi:hypothetical protein
MDRTLRVTRSPLTTKPPATFPPTTAPILDRRARALVIAAVAVTKVVFRTLYQIFQKPIRKIVTMNEKFFAPKNVP